MGEILAQALLNTVLGMGIVFTVLIFIALIIWSFKFLAVVEEKFKKKDKNNEIRNSNSVDNTLSQIIMKEVEETVDEIELVDDLELVAVITAAIYASLGDNIPTDGLIVRSIKKSNKSSWLRA